MYRSRMVQYSGDTDDESGNNEEAETAKADGRTVEEEAAVHTKKEQSLHSKKVTGNR